MTRKWHLIWGWYSLFAAVVAGYYTLHPGHSALLHGTTLRVVNGFVVVFLVVYGMVVLLRTPKA